MKSLLLKKIGHNSKLTSPPHTNSTSKCKENLQLLQGIIHKTLLWVKQKIKWLKQPLELWPTWPQAARRQLK
jgi:hypothetical protein